MPAAFDSRRSILQAVGQDLGRTEWMLIEQTRVDQFADATGDHQWIHVDPVRAAQGPFGACIAHGYLTLSLTPLLLSQLMPLERLRHGLNYGCNKVRFPHPVKVGARVRGHVVIQEAEAVAQGGMQVVFRTTVEIEGANKPGCVADMVVRYYFDGD
jgi:acyl dehydratase